MTREIINTLAAMAWLLVIGLTIGFIFSTIIMQITE